MTRRRKAQPAPAATGRTDLPPGVTATGGAWDPTEWPTYFIASNASFLAEAVPYHKHLLIAVNEIEGQFARREVAKLLDAGGLLFIDSGVFNLSTTHARRHGISMDMALSTAPEEIDGFDDLFERYVSLMREFGDRVWGYIEIDQGGRENKIRTRARLEGMGLRPIPVYHPFNDGWDYFDYLGEHYDRICLGNVVQADPQTRKRLLATMWERRRKYPHLFIHCLGLTPSDLTLAYPPGSCDSSTWLSGVRWGVNHAPVANRRVWELGVELCYVYGKEAPPERNRIKAVRLGAYDSHIAATTMRAFRAEQENVLGVSVGGFEP